MVLTGARGAIELEKMGEAANRRLGISGWGSGAIWLGTEVCCSEVVG